MFVCLYIFENINWPKGKLIFGQVTYTPMLVNIRKLYIYMSIISRSKDSLLFNMISCLYLFTTTIPHTINVTVQRLDINVVQGIL